MLPSRSFAAALSAALRDAALLLLLIGSAATSHAVPADIRLEQLHHTAWTAKDGAPPYTREFAQTSDGALWLGSDAGLFRFDGFRFERFNPPGTETKPLRAVSALLATDDGGLWIGMRLGGIYRLEADGRLTFHGDRVGLPADRTVEAMALGPDGTLYAGTSEGLYRKAADRWERVERGKLGRSFIYSLLFDRSGGLWISGLDGHFLLEKGAREPVRLSLPAGRSYLAEDASGAVWVAVSADDRNFPPGLLRAPRGAAPPRPEMHQGLRLQAYGGAVISDRDGGLWLARDAGIVRIADPSRIGRYVEHAELPSYAEASELSQRLTDNAPIALFEDRDGNIWVGTSAGIDRLRIPRLRKLPARLLPEVMGEKSLRRFAGGDVFVCDSAGGLFRIGAADPIALPGQDCQAATAGPDGSPWVAVAGKILRREGNAYVALPTPPEMDPVRFMAAMRFDGSQRLWVSSVRAGVFSYADGRWTRHAGVGAMPAAPALVIGVDAQGRAWFGYPGSRAVMWDGSQARMIDSSLGLRTGDIQTIEPYGDGVVVGGSEGMAVVSGNRIDVLKGEGGESFQGATAFFAGDRDDWWIHGRNAIYRIADEEIRAALKDPAHLLRFDRFDHGDGLVGHPPMMYAVPSGLRAADGRVWFATTAGVFSMMPPGADQAAAAAPKVELRSLTVEGRTQPVRAGQSIELHAGTRRLQIDYAAISITMPERVRFRYRMAGTGENWQVTATPSATYTNLEPGRYRFEIGAANGNGAWSVQPAVLDIEIPHPFYRQTWFYLACAVLAVIAAALLHRLRLEQVAAKVRLQVEARAKERERIARDLHDTLLQSTQGLILGMQAMADATPADAPVRRQLDHLLMRADAAVTEGRDKVMALRSGPEREALADALRAMAEELSTPGLPVSFRCTGIARALPAPVTEEIFQIGREAMRNAVAHAGANRIEVLLSYEPEQLRLRVEDDGCGMAEVLERGARPGRWGLKGMHERAEGIGGTLRVESPAGAGTQVELLLPAR